ncbi:MAG: hypothetical protein M3P24_09745 [Gemmatimonadota bacterium]|nr:hypothetical protein [Gemmatimonadota bacterium]
MRTQLLLLTALLAGCAAPAVTPGHVPTTGEYRYTSEYRNPDGSRAGGFSGTLLIREATPERISGVWAVPGYQRDVQIGAFHEGAYAANADVVSGTQMVGTFEHRVWRQGGATELRCEGTYRARVNARLVTYPATCALTYVGRGG